ncbi:MAG: DUF2239 family protein [Candidatus Hydrogenedentes bacterium]|nr:DUF2239 family protein [Candidatus Hydrogenedentota bacterium]
MAEQLGYTAFTGERCLVSGDLHTMLLRVKAYLDSGGDSTVLIFDDQTGGQVDFDFRGTPEDVLQRLERHPLFAKPAAQEQPRTGPGRPALGVTGREVTLLPRHWDWLAEQPGGASAVLRRLVERAMAQDAGTRRERRALDAAGKFMWAMAGNLPGFEEATRALYAGDRAGFEALVREWPEDIRTHAVRLARAGMESSAAAHG